MAKLTKAKIESIRNANNSKEISRPKTTTVEIYAPVPTVLAWHQLTQWRRAEELKLFAPDIWNDWVKKKLVPVNIVQKIEGQQTSVKYSEDSLNNAIKLNKIVKQVSDNFENTDDFIEQFNEFMKQKKKDENFNEEEFQIQ